MDIVLFNEYDLRIRDHEPLFRANKTERQLIHLFIWDCNWNDKTDNNIQNMGKYKKRFLKESLINLSNNLKKVGIHLNIFFGNRLQILDELITKYNIENLYTHYNEIKDNYNILDTKINKYWNNTMYHIDDLKYSINDLPNNYSIFKKNHSFQIRDEYFLKPNDKCVKLNESINIEDIDIEDCILIHSGGEDIAWNKIKNYLFNSKDINNYKIDRNSFQDQFNLGPWIDFGCISMKSIFFQLKIYEKYYSKNESTYLFWNDLLTKDYYKLKFLKFNEKMFLENGITNKNKKFSKNVISFKKLTDAQTGIPIIDSIILEMNSTGLISNLSKLIIASFLVNDLNIDWRLGAEYFNKMLLDSNIANNYNLWHYIVGLNSDHDRPKYLNPIKQCKLYDSDCEYIKKWIPILEDVNNSNLIDPKNGIPNYHNLLVRINFIEKKNL